MCPSSDAMTVLGVFLILALPVSLVLGLNGVLSDLVQRMNWPAAAVAIAMLAAIAYCVGRMP